MLSPRVSTIVSWTSDLFLKSRINELANSMALTAEFATSITELKERVSQNPKLVILDLATDEYDAIGLVKALKADRPGLKLLAFYPHVRKDLEKKAKEAGVDFVVPNSSFLQSLRKILQTGA